MTRLINIAGTLPIDDPAYRYQMPVIIAKIEGRGNGVKTVICNISEVAKSLHRDPDEIIKFFCCQLATSKKKTKDGVAINGSHTNAALQAQVHRYIEAFVLCPSCGLPETEYRVGSKLVHHKCKACGDKKQVDMSHDGVCRLIINKHKRVLSKSGKGNNKSKKFDAKGEKKDKSNEKAKREKQKDKAKKEKKGKAKSQEAKKSNSLDDAVFGTEKVNDSETTTAATEGLVTSEDSIDDAQAMDLAIQATRTYLERNPNASADAIVEEVRNQQLSLALKSHEKIHIYARAAIKTNFRTSDAKRYGAVVVKITGQTRFMERHLIASLEAICVDGPEMFPILLQRLYFVDSLEEETIFEWAGEGRDVYTIVDEQSRCVLHHEAKELLAWLSEEPTSDDEDLDMDDA